MKMWRINETHFNFRVFNKQFLGLVAISNTFEIVKNSNDSTRVRIRASNGFFLQVAFTLFLFGLYIKY